MTSRTRKTTFRICLGFAFLSTLVTIALIFMYVDGDTAHSRLPSGLEVIVAMLVCGGFFAASRSLSRAPASPGRDRAG